MTAKKSTERSQKVKKKALAEALDKSLGNISSACRIVGVSRECFYRWMKEDSEFKTTVENINEANIDFAETALLKNIREGKETSLIFYLKTKGKNRGYVERQELTGSDGGAIMPKIEIEIIDKAEDVDIKPYEDTDD